MTDLTPDMEYEPLPTPERAFGAISRAAACCRQTLPASTISEAAWLLLAWQREAEDHHISLDILATVGSLPTTALDAVIARNAATRRAPEATQ